MNLVSTLYINNLFSDKLMRENKCYSSEMDKVTLFTGKIQIQIQAVEIFTEVTQS